jgi:hypothetical protein
LLIRRKRIDRQLLRFVGLVHNRRCVIDRVGVDTRCVRIVIIVAIAPRTTVVGAKAGIADTPSESVTADINRPGRSPAIVVVTVIMPTVPSVVAPAVSVVPTVSAARSACQVTASGTPTGVDLVARPAGSGATTLTGPACRGTSRERSGRLSRARPIDGAAGE